MKRNPLAQQVFKRQEDPGVKRKRLSDVWSQSKAISYNDPINRYLQARGIKLNSYPSCLRYHSGLPYYHNGIEIGKFPVMIAMIQGPDGKAITLHRTYLGDGCKADVSKPKKLMSPAVKGASLGGAIQLYPPTHNGTIALAEGIESALAFHIASGLPIWATVSAVGMERIVLPASITNVLIAADNDHSGTGQKAASELASRLYLEGKQVKIIMPPTLGHDFADLLLEEGE